MATVHRERTVDAEAGFHQAAHELLVGRAARPIEPHWLLVEVDVRRHLIDFGHGTVAHAPVGAVLEHLADHLVGRAGDVHGVEPFDAPIGDLGAIEHLAHDFVGVLQFVQTVIQRPQRHERQMNARNARLTPLEQAAGKHRIQAIAVADQGQFQVMQFFIRRRTRKKVVQQKYGLGREDPFYSDIAQFGGPIAQLVAQRRRGIEELPILGDRTGVKDASVSKRLKYLHGGPRSKR